jgi:MHS family proline/betaine transporter-like MFS transporter
MTTLSRKPSDTTKLVKVGFAANILEWYDFAIYGYLVVMMGQNFLASDHAVMQTVYAYALFSISYLARPLGSFFYGYLGNTIGRGHALKSSLLTMAIPTALIGFLPTYHQVGALATVGLLILRFIQGFAAGGELPMSACYVFESAPAKYRSFLCSTVSAGSSIGLLLSSAVATFLFKYFDSRELLDWAWRIPYLLSVPIAFWIFYVRSAIEQQPALLTEEQKSATSTETIGKQFALMFEGIKSHVLPLMLLVAFMEVCVYVLLFWMPTYLSQFLAVPIAMAQSTNTIMLAIYIGFSLMSGYLSRFVGYKRLLIFHISAILLCTYPLFKALQGSNYTTLLGVHIAFAWLLSGVVAVMMETLGSTFDKEVRAFGMSITHTLSATFFGGTAPLICTYFTHKTGLILFPAFYMMGFAGLALILALRLPSPSKSLTITH